MARILPRAPGGGPALRRPRAVGSGQEGRQVRPRLPGAPAAMGLDASSLRPLQGNEPGSAGTNNVTFM